MNKTFQCEFLISADLLVYASATHEKSIKILSVNDQHAPLKYVVSNTIMDFDLRLK